MMNNEILKAFLEKNKVLTDETDLTKWKFDSYIDVGKKGTNYRKLPLLSKENESYKMILWPTEYWLEKDGDNRHTINPEFRSKKYQYLLTGSLDSPIYQEVLKDEVANVR